MSVGWVLSHVCHGVEAFANVLGKRLLEIAKGTYLFRVVETNALC